MRNLALRSDPRDLRIISAPHPFKVHRDIIYARPGQTVAELLAEVQPKPELRRFSHISVNGETIQPDMWGVTVPRAGSLIIIRIFPAGPIGRIFVAILTIAVAAFTTWMFAGLGPVWASVLGGMAGIATGVVGNMVLNALTPPAKTARPQISNMPLSNLSQGQDSPTHFISGATNQLGRWSVIPSLLGFCRIVPVKIGMDYTESEGKNQYVRCLFGQHGPVDVSQIKVGETDVENYEGVEMEIRQGYETDLPVTLYTNDIYEESLSVLLEYNAPQIRTTEVNANRFSIDITCPQGCYTVNAANGARESYSCNFLIEYRKTGTETWLAVENAYTTAVQVWNPYSWSSNNLPPQWNALMWIVYEGSGGGIVNGHWVSAGGYTPPDGYYTTSYTTASASLQITGATTSAIRKSLTCIVPSPGQYDVRPTRKTGNDGSQTVSTAYWTALRTIKDAPALTYPHPLALIATRFKASDQLNGTLEELNFMGKSIFLDWDAEAEEWTERITNNPASLFRALLQGQAAPSPYEDAEIDLNKLAYWHEFCVTNGLSYNKNIDQPIDWYDLLLEVAAAGRAMPCDYDGKISVIIDEEHTEYDGMYNARVIRNLEVELLYPDLPHAWRCPFKNEEMNYQQDERIVLDDGYQIDGLDAWGNAHPEYPAAEKFEQLVLEGVTNPEQIFKLARYHIAVARLRYRKITFETDLQNLANHRGDMISLAHDVIMAGLSSGRIKELVTDPLLPNLITGIYLDEQCLMEYGETYYIQLRIPGEAPLSAEVVNDTPTLDQVYVITSITYDGEIVVGMTFELYETAQYGDYWVISAVDEDGGEIVGFTLSNEVALEDSYLIYEVTESGMTLSNEAGELRDSYFLEFVTPIDSNDHDLSVGDLFSFGGHIDCIITDIKRKSDMEATITVQDAAPAIYAADQGTIPPHVSIINVPPEWWVPVIDSVRSGGDVLIPDVDGSWISQIMVSINMLTARSQNITGLEAQYWVTGSDESAVYLPVVPLDSGEVSIRPVEDGRSYSFRLRYVKFNGSRGPWCDTETHVVEGKTAPPHNVTGLLLFQVENVVTAVWGAVSDRDLAGYEIRYGVTAADWDDGVVLNGTYNGTSFSTTQLPQGVWDVMIKALDTSGNYSATEGRKTFEVTGFYLTLSDLIYGPLWAGTLTNLIRNPATGHLNPDDQDDASADDHDVFDNYVVNPYASYAYETPEIDLSDDVTARAWARKYTTLGPGEGGSNTTKLYFDYKLDGGAYDGYEEWSNGYFEGRYCKFKVEIDPAVGLVRIDNLQTMVDQPA